MTPHVTSTLWVFHPEVCTTDPHREGVMLPLTRVSAGL